LDTRPSSGFESKDRSALLSYSATYWLRTRDPHHRVPTRRTMMEAKATPTDTTLRQIKNADPRLARIRARDKTADGQFWYSVVTTGVYCRPSCPSRTANSGNIRFHDSIQDA